MEEITIYHIVFWLLFIWVLYFFFKTIKTISWNDFWKSWTSKLDEKNENKNISNSSTHLSGNPLFWWLTWYTIANLFNQNKDSDQNNWNEENINTEENNWNDEQSLDNENSDFEQNFDDFDSSFDSSFDDWWSDDWWFDWWSD